MTRSLHAWVSVLLVACGEPTIHPVEPPPPYGELGGFRSCTSAVSPPGDGSIAVRNEWTEVVAIGFVASDCSEVLVSTIAPGDEVELVVVFGEVYSVRDPDSLYLFAHFRALDTGPFEVVVP